MSSEPLRCAGALIVHDDGRLFFQRRSPDLRLFPHPIAVGAFAALRSIGP